jgi:hypothetical protein
MMMVVQFWTAKTSTGANWRRTNAFVTGIQPLVRKGFRLNHGNEGDYNA